MVAQLSSDTRLLGLDLARWPAQWRAAGQWLLARPALRALAPAVPVRLVGRDGQTSYWSVRQELATRLNGPSPSPEAGVAAAEISPDEVLERHLVLPSLSADDLAQAVRLEVLSSTPFPVDQTVHGWRARAGEGDLMQVDLALTSRQQGQAVLQRAGLDEQAEIWLLPADAATAAAPTVPLVLRGWGEAARQRASASGQRKVLGWIALLLVLLAALAVTPTLMLHQRAAQAQAALRALQQKAAPQQAQRETLLRSAELLRHVGELARQQLALPPVLDMLTRALPDGAWLNALQVDGDKVVAIGQADDAAALVKHLASQPGVSGVRLSSPATRGPGEAKERFNIELHADAARYGLVRAATGGMP